MIAKICGITNREDALAAIGYGASALGLNFWPRSPRYVSIEQAERILEGLPPSVWKVGVFVDEAPETIRQVMARLGLDVAQVHGACRPGPDPRLWQALPVGDDFDAAQLDRYAAEAFLLDAPAGAARGGGGRTFDWRRIAGLKHKIVLAGGLDASNVRQAIAAARPWGVDACSRLEASPGRKDPRKVEEFLRAALEAVLT